MLNWLINLFKKTPSPTPTISLENQLNNKYPKTSISYVRHETDGDYNIDVRDYFMINESSLPTITGKDDDEKALNCLIWIIKNIKYLDDKIDYGYDEYWAFPYQTFQRKKGDCEDMSILLANLIIKSGVPYYKIRISAGDVDDKKGNKGGHCFVTYYCEETNSWKLMDACYYPNLDPVNKRKDYKDETYYKNTWFSFNQLYCFAKGVKTDE
jgi:hypothetical protein